MLGEDRRTSVVAQRSTLKEEELSMDIPEQTSPPLATATVEDVQRDLVALRNDVSRLTQEVTNYVSKTGRQAVRDVNQQLEDAVRERPFAAVSIAAGLGLLVGAIFLRR